jgi:hypothetical protein
VRSFLIDEYEAEEGDGDPQRQPRLKSTGGIDPSTLWKSQFKNPLDLGFAQPPRAMIGAGVSTGPTQLLDWTSWYRAHGFIVGE